MKLWLYKSRAVTSVCGVGNCWIPICQLCDCVKTGECRSLEYLCLLNKPFSSISSSSLLFLSPFYLFYLLISKYLITAYHGGKPQCDFFPSLFHVTRCLSAVRHDAYSIVIYQFFPNLPQRHFYGIV